MCTLNTTSVPFHSTLCGAIEHNGELCSEVVRLVAASVPFWAHPACLGFGHVVHLCGRCSWPTARAQELVRLARLYMTYACDVAPRLVVARKVRRAA